MDPGDRVFIDTDVLVYAEQEQDSMKRELAIKQIRQSLDSGKAFISNQILAELSSVLLNGGIGNKELEEIIKSYKEAFNYLEYSFDDLVLAGELSVIRKAPFFDSLIASTMKANGIGIIITENEKDFRKFGFLKIVNPF